MSASSIAVRVGVVACVAAAGLLGVTKLDEAVAVFDFEADTNAASTFNDRVYPEIDGLEGAARVIEDARLWMPEDATYRVVDGPTRPGGDDDRLATHLPGRPPDAATPDGARVGALGVLLRLHALDARARVRGALRLGTRPRLRPEAIVTLRAIGGLLVLNVFILGVGAAVLWGIRGWRWWTELARHAGVAYFLGLSALMVVSTLELVVGIPVEPATILLSGAAVAAAGLVVGRWRGFVAPGLRPPDWRFPRISVFAAVFLAGIVVYFEAFLRAARLSGVVASEWDSWANWLPKSRSLYLTGHLDLDFLALVPQPLSYPPGHTTIQALAFHAMGSADTATLHLQYWLMAAFFAVGVIGLLAGRVRDGDPVPGAAGVPRRALPARLAHDGLRGHPVRLLHRPRCAARHPLGRGEGDLAPRRPRPCSSPARC